MKNHLLTILTLLSTSHPTLQFEQPINTFLSTETLSETTFQPPSRKPFKVIHNSDEIHSKSVECHFDSNAIDFEPQITCVVREKFINSNNFVISPPENLNITKFLMINNKKIEFIPNEIGKNFYNMSVMVASGNGIKAVTKKELTRLYRLKILNLESNEIEKVKFNAFDDLISVEIIDLDDNKIKELDGKTLSSNMYLKIFSARNNQLETLHEDIFEHTMLLDTVKLQGNKIIRLSHKLLDHVPSLKTLLLERNLCVDKNYEGGRLVSTFAVDMAKMCGERVEESTTNVMSTSNFPLVSVEEEKTDFKMIICIVALSVFIISSIIAGISFKIYKSKQWQVRMTTVDAFENPHYSKDPERNQESVKNVENKTMEGYHEFNVKQLNDEARYVNLPKNADADKTLTADHLYEEVKEDQQKCENCCENPNYGN